MSTKKLQSQLTLHMKAGKATPAPPVGPILGQHGVNIGAFVKEFNDKTMDTMKQYAGVDVKVPVLIRVYIDRSYDMQIFPPLMSDLLKWKAGIKSGSATPNKVKVATLSKADLEDIIAIKMPVMNTKRKDSLIKSITGTAKSMGIEVK